MINTGENTKKAITNFDILHKELENLEAQLIEVRQNFVQVQKKYRDRQTELAKTTAFEKNLKTDIDVSLTFLSLNVFD